MQDILKQAVQAGGMADLATVTRMLEVVLGRHKRCWRQAVGAGDWLVVSGNASTGDVWCYLCGQVVAPACDAFALAMAQLTIIELLDGTRFSDSWRGPIEARDYR